MLLTRLHKDIDWRFFKRRQQDSEQSELGYILRVPLEILIQILECLVAADDLLSSSTPIEWLERRTKPAWLNMSHACTHLRAAALAAPHLWASAASIESTERWHRLCATRAGIMPLSITVAHPPPSWRTAYNSAPVMLSKEIMASTHPITAIHAFLPSGSPDVHALVTRGMAHLRSLVYWPHRFSESTEIPSTWLAPSSGSLTQLTLCNLSLAMEDLRLPMLLRFELRQVTLRDGLDPLLRFLEKIPELEFLALNVVHAESFEGARSTSLLGHVPLPRLKDTYLNCNPFDVLLLVRILSSPSDVYSITAKPCPRTFPPVLTPRVLRLLRGTPIVTATHQLRASLEHDKITFEHPGVHSRIVRYSAAAGAIPRDGALTGVRIMRLDPRSCAILARGSAEMLAALEHLTLADAWRPEVADPLRHWLVQRAESGQRLRTLTLLRGESAVGTENDRVLNILAEDLLARAWVEEVAYDE